MQDYANLTARYGNPVVLPSILRQNGEIIWKDPDKKLAEYLVHPIMKLGALLWWRDRSGGRTGYLLNLARCYNAFILDDIAYHVNRIYAGPFDSRLHSLVKTDRIVEISTIDAYRSKRALNLWLERML